VEPLTGQHVDFNLNWESYFEEDGKLTTLVEKGSKKTTSEYVEKLVEETKTKSLISNITHYFTPFIFLIIGSFFVIYSYLKRTKELEKTIGVQTLELIKAEKLAIIGTLSSRVTHDIRNPLSVIKISSDLIKKQLVDSKIVDSIITEKIELIQDSVERITHQVDDVLDFVRRRPVKLGKIMISEIIRESLDTLNIPNNVELILPKKDVEILCDKRQFSVVMNNLILNGIQAIDSIGTIEIAVEEDNDVIIIQVKDSGKGMPKETLNHIFEPLFTTKMEGTGLGLASVKSIIRSHNGEISVTSPPTVFTITLPQT
jgi:signal transduction histidine kinase